MPTPLSSAVSQDPRPVLVLGATGFIGRFVVDELCRQTWRVRVLIRRATENPWADRNIEVARGDVCDATSMLQAIAGVQGVVNLAGAKCDEAWSEAVNVGGARNLVAAARANGGTRIVHISTQAVKIARQGLYARTKRAAECVFADSGLPVTILRPSVVYGPGDSGVFSTMQRWIERLPVVPVLGDGKWTSAPVHVADIARAVVACLGSPTSIGQCYDLGGPDLVTLDELLDRIAACCGRPCRKVHVPLGVSLRAAQIAARVLPRPPLSVSNVLGSNQPIPIDWTPARRDLNFNPLSLETGLRLVAQEAEERARRDEARRYARYLLNIRSEPEMIDRYVAAAGTLFAAGPDREVLFVRRHPWTLPFLDAVVAVFRRRSQLRQRVLLMAALLETSPVHADFFLAPPPPPLRLAVGVCSRGLSSLAKLLVGGLLLPFVSASCRRTWT